MLSSGRSLLTQTMAGQYDTSIIVKKAGTIDDMGRTQLSWASPTTVTTVQGIKQPAGTQVLERAGLLAKDAPYQVFMEPTALTPQTNRLTIGGVDHEIAFAEAWPSHSVALVREVRA